MERSWYKKKKKKMTAWRYSRLITFIAIVDHRRSQSEIIFELIAKIIWET